MSFSLAECVDLLPGGSDRRVGPGALGGKGVLEALPSPVLFPVSCPLFLVINDWEGKMCNREGEGGGECHLLLWEHVLKTKPGVPSVAQSKYHSDVP